MDVKLAFLNGILEEEIYVQYPRVYEVEGNEKKVYKLKIVLFGIKKAPRACFSIINHYMIKNGFCRKNIEPTLYT